MAFQYKKLDIGRDDSIRKVCFGWVPRADSPNLETDKKRFVGRLGMQLASSTYNMPIIESVRIHYPGALSPANVTGSFGASIDPFGSNLNTPPPGASSVESTLAEPGKLQTFGLICALGWHLEPVPWVWSTIGNAFPSPTVGTTKPISPDVFTGTDQGITGGVPATMIPALVNYGAWQERFFYHMVRAYNLIWQMGSRTNIVRDSLRYTAWVPSNAQEGSASSSMVDATFDINQGNQYYVNSLASPFIFLSMDRIRVGGEGATGAVVGQSSFRPFRNDIVSATYGGAGVRAYLRGNTDFRKLTVPYLMKPGVPIGLRADISDADEQQMMQSWVSATFSPLLPGTIPAQYTDFPNINSGLGAGGNELQLDGTNDLETTLAQRIQFKFGPFKVTTTIKGFELTDDQADALKGIDLATALAAECGVQMAT